MWLCQKQRITITTEAHLAGLGDGSAALLEQTLEHPNGTTSSYFICRKPQAIFIENFEFQVRARQEWPGISTFQEAQTEHSIMQKSWITFIKSK